MTREMLLEKSLDDLRLIAKTVGLKAVTKYRRRKQSGSSRRGE